MKLTINFLVTCFFLSTWYFKRLLDLDTKSWGSAIILSINICFSSACFCTMVLIGQTKLILIQKSNTCSPQKRCIQMVTFMSCICNAFFNKNVQLSRHWPTWSLICEGPALLFKQNQEAVAARRVNSPILPLKSASVSDALRELCKVITSWQQQPGVSPLFRLFKQNIAAQWNWWRRWVVFTFF